MASADYSGHADVPPASDPPPGTAFRAVARVRSTRRGRVYTARKPEPPDDRITSDENRTDRGRGVASVPKNREETRRLEPPPPPASPVFVDESGRRGRLLAWAAIATAVAGLLLIVAFWVGQATGT